MFGLQVGAKALLAANTSIYRLDADSQLLERTVLMLPEGWEPAQAAAQRVRMSGPKDAEEVRCCEPRLLVSNLFEVSCLWNVNLRSRMRGFVCLWAGMGLGTGSCAVGDAAGCAHLWFGGGCAGCGF